jgi:hypothetical protein
MAGATGCLQKSILEICVMMWDCKEDWLHAVFEYASVDQI